MLNLMIINNTLREKLNAGKPTTGTHFLTSDPDIPELIGDTGLFDYAEFGTEYSAFDMRGLYHLARAAQCGNLPLMIKPDQASQEFWAQAALGAGFSAVLFTDIRSSDDVRRCHRAVRADTPEREKFARGNMGVKLRRPALSGYAPEGYLENLDSLVVAIMIEKRVAVDQIDEILSTARDLHIDMTQWGPADFGLSNGTLDFTDKAIIEPFEELVIRKSIEYGVPPRIEIGDVEQAKRYLDLGVRHFCIGWDRFILHAGLTRIGEGMRRLMETV